MLRLQFLRLNADEEQLLLRRHLFQVLLLLLMNYHFEHVPQVLAPSRIILLDLDQIPSLHHVRLLQEQPLVDQRNPLE